MPAIALSAALACTMAGCGGTEGGQGGSNGNEPAGQTVDSVQTAEVAGFTIESVGDGSYYRGAAERQDGFWLRAKITNNNESAKAPSAFSARAAVGTFDAGDAVFDASGDQRLNADTRTQAVELGEGAQMDANAKIEPGESIEWVYFWTTKDNYYGPITVQFDKNATGGTDPRTMRFDTTGKETDGYKAAVEAAEAIKAQGGGIQREGCRRLGARRDQGEEQRRHVQPRGLHEALQHQHVLARPAEGSRGAAGQLRRQG